MRIYQYNLYQVHEFEEMILICDPEINRKIFAIKQISNHESYQFSIQVYGLFMYNTFGISNYKTR